MAEDHFFVELAKLKTVEANVERVNRLFHVDISSVIVHDEPDLARVHFTSSNGSNLSQKNIEKAQAYLLAVLELSENFTKEKICLSKDQNTMVLHERNNIERTCQVVLLDENEYIIVQGKRKCVDMAREQIYSMSDQRRSMSSLICDADPLMIDDFQKLDIGNQDENIDSSPSHSSHYIGENYDKDHSVTKGLECDKQGKFLDQLSDDNLETDCYANPSLNLLTISSHETEADHILSDPKNSPQIEKALKLGYSEHHIVAVLKKLRVSVAEVDSNTLLSELIKVSDLAPETHDASPLTLQKDNDYDEDEGEDIVLEDDADNLRHIVIDGSNVAMSHGNKDVFSCRGIQLAVDYFQNRGHKKITVFVPQWRKEFSRNNSPITDQDILKNLEKEKKLKFTPSRRISGRRVVCYDDRFILELAHSQNGIIVSNDNYRDLHNEKKEYKKVAEEQLLQYLFVDDKFMPPQDPLGRHGPSLDNFLRIRPIVSEPQQLCPYGKKCTYGNKCRFSHPERGNRPHRSVTEMLTEQSSQKLKDRAVKMEEKKKKDMSMRKQNLRRTQSMFPDEHGSYDSFNLNSSNDENKVLKKTLSYAPEYFNKEIQSCQQLHVEAVIDTSSDASPAPISTPNTVPKVSIQTEKCTDIQNEQVKTSNEKKPEVLTSTSPPQTMSTHISQLGSEEVLVTGHLLLAKKLSDDAQDRPSKFFDSDKDDKTACLIEPQKGLTDHSQIKTNFNQAVSHQMTDHNLPASEFRFPPNEFASTFCSGPPTVMRQNTISQTYDGQCRSFPFHEREYGALNKELHTPSDIQARCTGSSSNNPHPAHLQSNLFLRQSSVVGQHLNSPGMEQIPSLGNHGFMIPHQHSMLSYDGSLPVNQPIAQQPFLYTRQNSEVPYQADQQYYTLLHQTPAPYPVYQPSYVNSQPSVQMQPPVWPRRQNMVGHGTPAQQSQYTGGYHPSVLSPPVSQATTEEILPTDPRYPVYYHLCQLFNEKEVKAAMMAYPQETDPKTLVSFILQLKHIPS